MTTKREDISRLDLLLHQQATLAVQIEQTPTTDPLYKRFVELKSEVDAQLSAQIAGYVA